ncbi:MAG TPA: hypothetical protein VMM12_14710 [Longimicrobiales bacterium]|nr:hypothetical protein [Longimicrobiales bacterium]
MELTTILFHAHSGLRYLVLLAGVVAFLYTLVAALRSRPWDRAGRILLAVFAGVLDLQILIGIVLIFVYRFYPALWGHLTMMVLAAASVHVASAVNKRRPPERRSPMTAALGAAGGLILIIGGIAAIQRSIL